MQLVFKVVSVSHPHNISDSA